MSVQYSDVPPGGVGQVPPVIPQDTLYRVKHIMGVTLSGFAQSQHTLLLHTAATRTSRAGIFPCDAGHARRGACHGREGADQSRRHV